MAGIIKDWAGHVYGTNTGKLYVEFDGPDNDLTGRLRFLDDDAGLVVYKITGRFSDGGLTISGTPEVWREGIIVGPISAAGLLTPEGYIRGKWESEIGTGGTFHLFPHDQAPRGDKKDGENLLDRLHTAARPVGTVRLYEQDVRDLIEYVGRDFGEAQVIVTYHDQRNETSQFSKAFLAGLPRNGELKYLRLNVQQEERAGIRRTVTIELNSFGENRVTAQGLDEAWVIGKAESLASFLKNYEKFFADRFRRTGVTFTNGLLAATIIFAPELPLGRRSLFVIAMIIIALIYGWLHARYVPNAIIYLSPKQESGKAGARPQFVSGAITFVATVLAAIVYGLLSGELKSWLDWIL